MNPTNIPKTATLANLAAAENIEAAPLITKRKRHVQLTIKGHYHALVTNAIKTLQHYQPQNKPYWGCFSGGKDSVVIKQLARIAGIYVEWHHNVTTIDPPEVNAFIKRQHPDVIRHMPERTFLKWIETKGVPTRRCRWCCEKLEERGAPPGKRLIMGIRAQESPRRAKNWSTLTILHYPRNGQVVAPILNWHKDDVWKFIEEKGIAYCKLYDQGYTRTGCILCPMAGPNGHARDLRRYPTVCRQIEKAAKAYWNRRKEQGGTGRSYSNFNNADDFWDWWIADGPMPGGKPHCQGQLEFWS